MNKYSLQEYEDNLWNYMRKRKGSNLKELPKSRQLR